MTDIPARCRVHWLVDLENVQGRWAMILKDVRAGDAATLFVSDKASSAKLTELARICAAGAELRLAECEHGRPNAMDFQLVAELGRLSVLEPDTEFRIVSADTGFQSIIKYMAARGAAVRCLAPEDVRDPDPEPAPPRPADPVREEYRRRLAEAGVPEPDLKTTCGILYAAMQESQNARKLSCLNRLRTRYGDTGGRERYAAIKALVHDIAAHGPLPGRNAPGWPRADTGAVNELLGKGGVQMRPGDAAKLAKAVADARMADDPARSLEKKIASVYGDAARRARSMDALKHLLEPLPPGTGT